MILRKWDDLPEGMKNEKVRKYYEILNKRKFSLLIKRVFDIMISLILLIVLLPMFLLLSVAIKIDSDGPIIFCQTRVTQYGKQFQIFKFRTMVNNAEEIGFQVTTRNDLRITRVGKFLRKFRLDEIPQLINILAGDMTFVGTRPEVVKYVEKYADEMMATLLLPAGVTSQASILYKDEEMLLEYSQNLDETYINKILPEKMMYNFRGIEQFGFIRDIKIMFKTIIVVIEDKRKSVEKPLEHGENI